MTGERTIIRAAHGERPYFMMLRSAAQNVNLSYEALGLLTYLLSKPDDWRVHPDTLIRPGTGRDKVYKLLRELRAAGHVERIIHRDEQQRMKQFEYVIHEQPLPTSEREPLPEKPDMEKPYMANAHNTEYREIQNREITAPLAAAYEPPAIRVIHNDTAAQMNGWQLAERYATETNLPAETIWQSAKKTAAALARAGIVPEDVTAFLADLKRTQPDRWNGYRFNYLAEDLPRWKQRQAEQPAANPAAERAALEAAERARLEWDRERAAEWAQAAGGEL